MENYRLFNKRNLLITGLATLVLLATAGCATLKNEKIEPTYSKPLQSKVISVNPD